MAKLKKKKSKKQTQKLPEEGMRFCALPPVRERQFDASVSPLRARLIRITDRKWVNGTTLHYYFFDRSNDGPGGRWVGPETQRAAVRKAFKKWKDLGLGLEFVEVAEREDAEIRIAFDPDDGSWSYVGRDVIDQVKDSNVPTMNFGWDLTTPYGGDTALHEIGHTLGFPHEHQNPLAGIVWNEPEVYTYFRGSPNFWNDQQINWNILRKLPAGSISGTSWDPNSVMHYHFAAGLISKPEDYVTRPLTPAGGLSKHDIQAAKEFYPSLENAKEPELVPFQSRQLKLGPGEQANFRIRPAVSRRYTIQTFGTSDSVIVLFEDAKGKQVYVAGDDDGGQDRNALLDIKLTRGKEYVLRVRLYYSQASGETAVMLW
jgi:hypothetical protein